MARPTKPLITKEKTLEAALKIVDEEGLSALSVRRLGRELSVNGYSLYHHFENKDGIVVALCEYVLEQVESDIKEGKSWQECIFESQMQVYDALSRHPNLVSALLKYNLLGVQKAKTEHLAQTLIELGLPAEAFLPLTQGLTVIMAGILSLEPLAGNSAHTEALETETPFIHQLATTHGFMPHEKLLELTSKSWIEEINRRYSA